MIEKYSYAIAGASGAAAGMLIDRKIHHNSILVFWILVRSLYNALPSFGPIGPVVFMCLSASQLLSSWIRAPHDLNKYAEDMCLLLTTRSYLAFLDYQSGVFKSDRLWASGNQFIARPCFLVHPNHVRNSSIVLLTFLELRRTRYIFLFGRLSACLPTLFPSAFNVNFDE